MNIPRYIQTFMGKDWRKKVDARLNLMDFEDNNFDSPVNSKMRGCYIISATTKSLEYPRGSSPVIYIGLSNNLLRRLKSEHYQKHLKVLVENPNYGLNTKEITMMPDRYQYMLAYGARVDVFVCKGAQEQKNLESMLLASFYNRYRAMPVGNAARSFQKTKQ